MAISTSLPSIPKTVTELNDAKKEIRELAVSDIEKEFLLEALRLNEYNVSKAAQQTGMQRTNFQALLKKYNLRIKDIAANHSIQKT